MPNDPQLTLMAVHAHPDDEASTTGGILCKYADEGIRTVLVTCTNGELGDSPEGAKPGEPGHDPEAVALHRRGELDRSVEILAIDHLEMLGYHDSGMMGWDQNKAPHAFWNTPVDEAADRLVTLIERYRPEVVVTYDENGFYGHPDHIQANRITVAALAKAPIVAKLYYPVIPKSDIPRFTEALAAAGFEPPEGEEGEAIDFGVDDDLVAARIDCRQYAPRKFQALEAHSSQGDNTFFLRLGQEVFAQVFGEEVFRRAQDTTGAPIPEDDLFAGIRS